MTDTEARLALQYLAEIKTLRAERQQAIDERDALQKNLIDREAEGYQTGIECSRLRAQLEQAIGALREIIEIGEPKRVTTKPDGSLHYWPMRSASEVARAALVKLGEAEQP